MQQRVPSLEVSWVETECFLGVALGEASQPRQTTQSNMIRVSGKAYRFTGRMRLDRYCVDLKSVTIETSVPSRFYRCDNKMNLKSGHSGGLGNDAAA